MRNIIITGAGGMVATELAFNLLKCEDISLYLLSTDPQRLEPRYEDRRRVRCFSLEDFSSFAGQRNLEFDALIHTAFARSEDGKSLMSSLEYQKSVLELVLNYHIHSFVNISSQGVYGMKNPPLWNEDSPVTPESMYALAKSASEVITEAALNQKSDVNYTSIRLSSVCENARFLSIFVKNALAGISIKVFGGSQKCSFIDVRDAAEALTALIDSASEVKFAPVYNLGTGKMHSVQELAEIVKKVGTERYGLDVKLEQVPSDLSYEVGMDSGRFMETFSWSPRMSIEDMVISLFELHLGGGNLPISFTFVH